MERTNGKRIAIVTGSALGLGYELTRQLIDRGWFVAGIDFNAERQTELAGEFPRGSYRGFVGDVSDEDFVKASVADIAKIGHIDLLINNAGQPSFKTPTAYEAADVDKCLKGLKGMILWCVQTLKACDEQNLKIANVMSTALRAATPTNPCTAPPNGVRRGTRRASRPRTRGRASPSWACTPAASTPTSTARATTTSHSTSSTRSCPPPISPAWCSTTCSARRASPSPTFSSSACTVDHGIGARGNGRQSRRRPAAGDIESLYRALSAELSPTGWWPADTTFEIMVGAVLTQNTAWGNVDRSLAALKAESMLDPHALTVVEPERLQELIRPSGFYVNKSKTLRSLSRWYVERCDASPEGADGITDAELRAELLGLFGIGGETADDMMLYVFSRRTFVADTYARRLFAFLGFDAPAGYPAFHKAYAPVVLNTGLDVADLQEFHGLIDEFGKAYRDDAAKNESFLQSWRPGEAAPRPTE